MRALVLKELRQLAPLALGLAAILLWASASSMILDPPDQQGWAALSWLADAQLGRLSAWLMLVLGVVTAYNLLPGEHDQRTIEFLYTLPVRRRTLFLVKYLVGAGLLATFSMLGTAIGWLEQSLHPGSFERHQARPAFYLIELAADLALSFIAVAYGLVLAYFRRLGWILFLLIWLALELSERLVPALAILNIKSMLEVEHHGTRPLVRWSAWQAHGLMAVGALLLAGRLWLVQPEGFTAFYLRLRERRALRRLALGAGMFVLALVAVPLMVSVGLDEAPEVGTDQPVRSLDTEHFRFSYHPGHEVQAHFIGREADQAYRRVRERLAAPAVEHIVADLTETSDEHLGIAGWKRMRLDIRPPKSEGLLRHVLYHETTHVLAAAMAEGISGPRDAEARFFAEGLAEWVTYQLLGPAAEGGRNRDDARRVAGLAHARFRLRFQDLLDPEDFIARHDEYLLYALGEVWVAAMVETCGAGSPAKLLRAFGRAAGPQRLQGAELWRNSLQAAGCDLDRVIGRYEQRLRQAEADAAGVPIAAGSLVGERDGQLLFQLSVESPEPRETPWRVTVRVREDPEAPPDQVVIKTVTWSPGTTAPVAIPAPPGTGRRIQFQVGARSSPEAPAFFSRWQSSTRVGG